MDFCLDCGRLLRDLFCYTCKMIYIFQIEENMVCINCSHAMIVKGSSTRYRCNYCLHRYFVYGSYNESAEKNIKEFINSLEKQCPECKNRMLVNPANKELVCQGCGLVYEDPIYTQF